MRLRNVDGTRPRRHRSPVRDTTIAVALIGALGGVAVAAVPVVANLFARPTAKSPSALQAPRRPSSAPSAEDYSKVFGGKQCSTPAAPRSSVERVSITSPTNRARVGRPDATGVLAYETIKGTAELAPDEKLWLFFYATDPCLYYAMGSAEVAAGRWEHQIVVAAHERGAFVLYAVVVGGEDNRRIEAALQEAREKGVDSPALYRLPPRAQASYLTLVCCR